MSIQQNIIKFILFGLVIIFLGVFLFAFLKTDSDELKIVLSYHPERIPYNLSHPDKQVDLPLELAEISGITYLNDQALLFIEDEVGIIYSLDFQKGVVTGKYHFAKDGDFEDIVVMMHKIYALRSDGKIYRIKDLGLKTQRDKNYNTLLTRYHDAEGLTYCPTRHALLIACKGEARLNPSGFEKAEERGIYAFDLYERALVPEPLFILDLAKFREQTNANITKECFQPSGIAVHPLSRNIYIISSVGDVLLVLNSEGELISMSPLDNAIFKQPEGICFAPDGTLYISNEGRSGYGNVLSFHLPDDDNLK